MTELFPLVKPHFPQIFVLWLRMSKLHDEIHKNVLMVMCCVGTTVQTIDYPGLSWITLINSKIIKLVFSQPAEATATISST